MSSANPPLSAGAVPAVSARVSLVASESTLLQRTVSWLLPLGVLAVYLCFPTKNYYWDGISFASSIENSSGLSRSLIHPHHLLYNVFGYLIYQLAQLAGWHVRAIEVLQISNSVLSALCAVLLFRFLNRTLRSPQVTTLLVVAFSSSATWWKYSTDADSYIPSVLCLVICLNLLLAVKRIKPFLLALVHTASMCLHQLAVFFYPVIVVGILLHPQYPLRKRVRLVLQYSAAASLTTLAINYYCFHLQTGAFGIGDFGRWLTSYVQGPDSYSFSFNVLSNLGYTLRGQTRLFFEGRLNWISGLISVPVILLIGALIGLVIALGWRFLKALPKVHFRFPLMPKMDSRLKALAAVSFVWLGVYLAFLFFWYPYFTPYRIFYLTPLICLGGAFLIHKETLIDRRRKTTAAMFVAAMVISNFVFFILPLSRSEKYPPLAFALQMNQSWSRGTVIYYAKSNADNQLIRYFNPSTSWRNLKSSPEDSIENELDQVYQKGGTAWLETSSVDQVESSLGGAAWLADHTRSDCRKKLVNRSYRIKFVQVFPLGSVAKLNSDCSLIANVHEDTFK